MGECAEKVAAMEAVLASTTTFDRFAMDRAFQQLAGLDIGALDSRLSRKLDRIFSRFNELAFLYPDARDPLKPLPATALVSYAGIMQEFIDLAH